MKKSDYLCFVRQCIFDNPEWMEDTITVCCLAVLNRVKEDRKVNVDIQSALLMLKDRQFGKLPKVSKISVLKAMLQLDTIEGTPYAEKIKESLEKLEKK